MIWDDPKYARVVMALEPIRWHKPDDEGYRYELECSPIDGWGITEGFHPVEDPDDDSRVTSDFVTACILAEFAEKWLAERGAAVNRLDPGLYDVEILSCETGKTLLFEDGMFHPIERGGKAPKGFTDRHEALADGMLAFLREDGEL